MKIYLIRHCESEDDILNCYGGCADFDLTIKGESTARTFAPSLVNLNIEKIYTSPYRRAHKVAKIFADQIHCNLEVIDNLKEMNTYGVMSGVNKDLAKEIFKLLLESDEYKSFGYYKGKSFLGGEEVNNFDNRIKEVFNYIVKQPYQTVAIVTHGGVFRSIYKNILNRSERILDIEDAATIEIEYNNNYTIIQMKGIKTE